VSADTTPAPSAPTGSACDEVNVDDAVSQAANQYSARFPKSALNLITKAIACKPDARLYRLAAMYACAAREASTAMRYYAKVSAQFQPAIAQRCQQEDIAIP